MTANRKYKLLLLSSSDKLNTSLLSLLSDSSFEIVKVSALSAKIEELRLINRAKCVLIDQLRMSEADAHHYIEKQAMNRCISRRAMAEKILSAYR